MNMLKNILALIGLFSVIGLFIAVSKISPILDMMDEFDPKAKAVYLDLGQRILENRSGVSAMVNRVPVQEGLTADDVDESIRYIANELNIKQVGQLPLSKEVENISGAPFRHIKIYLLCNPMTAATMLNYDDAFSSFLPCRISVVEDKAGKLWLYAVNMDIMIHGGRSLPPALKVEAVKVQDTIKAIMERAAKGDF
ncbi:MAG: DUF302 domain-containing protein [Gammaproteobacteria bacterium]|nr:DUF302 domain-containing protein [Gammaproteobacteria bacterium]